MLLVALNHGFPSAEAAVSRSINAMFIAADQPRSADSLVRGYGKLVRSSDQSHSWSVILWCRMGRGPVWN